MKSADSTRLARQSFLGPHSPERLDATTVGFVGLGGGGSHMVQQTAHIGIGGYVIADPDHIEDSNTNRLIGGTLADVRDRTDKVQIYERLIRGLVPRAPIIAVKDSWHSALEALRCCDVILGAVDTFREREQLERFARRNLIPYIDIGMDVHDCGEHGYLISGQVILSTPGYPCMRCCRFITDERLKREAEDYGAAGSRPQVVWPNGVLASTAIGLLVKLITPWMPRPEPFIYLEYDGNKNTISNSVQTRFRSLDMVCLHHPADETGDPFFDIRALLATQRDRTLSAPPAAEA